MTLPLAGLRIGLLTASASRSGGGVFEAVVQQAAMIRSLGGEAPVFALADRHSADDAHRFAGSTVSYSAVRGPAQVGFAPELLDRLLAAELDLLHLHGIWMYPSRAGLLWARRTERRYLISTHGMLDPATTGRRRWKKWIGKVLYETASWRQASAFHALTASEAANIRREAGPVEIRVIPNAGPAPLGLPTASRPPRLVYVGRIHAIKNLAALVEGWRQAQLPDGARLTIAGWGDAAEVRRLKGQIAEAGPSVEFVGPVFGEDKQALLAAARFMVLPSLSEAMPMAILEGWAAGVPAILTSSCNLPEGFAAGAALECRHDPAAIARTIEQALALDQAAWLVMAGAAAGLAAGPFSATTVAAMWAAAYRGEPLPQGSAAP